MIMNIIIFVRIMIKSIIFTSQKVSSCKLLIARSHFLGESRLSFSRVQPADHEARDEEDGDDDDHNHDGDDDGFCMITMEEMATK